MSLSQNVVSAHRDLAEHAERIIVVASMNASRFEQLPPDDFLAQKTSGLREPLKLFLEDYTDRPEDSFQQAVPISTLGTKRVLLPLAATAAGLLFQLGHAHVGIAVVDSTGRGVVFQYRSAEDVVCRGVTEFHQASAGRGRVQ